jgi:F420-dependent oxidoreductase-like protein
VNNQTVLKFLEKEQLMIKAPIPRRHFLKNAGRLAALAAVAGRWPFPRTARAASHSADLLSFGIQTPPQNVTYSELQQTWLEADELGYDSAFGFDHFFPIFTDPTGSCLEGWTLLSALAAQTKQLKIGLLVTGNTYRNPAVLAKMAATVDHVSNGRLILGLGAGWFELEHTALDIPYYTPGQRARRLVEAVELIKLLFTQEKTNYRGKYYTITDAPFEPKPVQKPHPPILIGGMGPRVIQPLAARHANIWHFSAREGGLEGVKKACAHFDAICQKVGRDPAEVQKSVSLRLSLLKRPSTEIIQRIKDLREAGVHYFILSLFENLDHTLVRRFATQVIPEFRQA